MVEGVSGGRQEAAGWREAREATSDEVKELKAEARQLKETLAEILIENRLLSKSVLGDREDASWSIPHPKSSRSSSATVVALDPSDTGADRDPEIDVLRLVQSLPGGRDRSSGGWQAESAADLEQNP